MGWQSQPSCRQVAPVVPSCAAQLDRGGPCSVCHAGAVQAAWHCCCPPCCAHSVPCSWLGHQGTAHRAVLSLCTHSPGASTSSVLLGECSPLGNPSAPPWIPHWFANPRSRCSLAVQSPSSCPHEPSWLTGVCWALLLLTPARGILYPQTWQGGSLEGASTGSAPPQAAWSVVDVGFRDELHPNIPRGGGGLGFPPSHPHPAPLQPRLPALPLFPLYNKMMG